MLNLKNYRSTASTDIGDFRTDSTTSRPFTHVVVAAGYADLPLAAERRIRMKEGFIVAWCFSQEEAEGAQRRARGEGLVHVTAWPVETRELPFITAKPGAAPLPDIDFDP